MEHIETDAQMGRVDLLDEGDRGVEAGAEPGRLLELERQGDSKLRSALDRARETRDHAPDRRLIDWAEEVGNDDERRDP
jgi:hypothetical protein